MRRIRARVATRGSSATTRFGSQRRPSRNSTMVTTSTASCVSARSGAENQTNVRQMTSPATASIVSAARRWNFACQAAADRAGHADRPQRDELERRRQRAAGRPSVIPPRPHATRRRQHGEQRRSANNLRLQPPRAEELEQRRGRAQVERASSDSNSRLPSRRRNERRAPEAPRAS